MILDEYLEGYVERISPEAPVPVHLVQGSRFSAGGAANVCLNIKGADAEAVLFSVAGKDEASVKLKSLLENAGAKTQHIRQDEHRLTVRKTRVTSQNQQLLRIDWEKVEALSKEHEDSLLTDLSTERFDAIILSDYGKGLLSTRLIAGAIAIARSQNIPLIVDPKGKDYTKYHGCDFITPNLKEIKEALDDRASAEDTPEDLARKLIEKHQFKNVLLTLGAKGMIWVNHDPSLEPVYKPAKAIEVYDVSGAGDTVVALLSLGLAAKLGMNECLEIATLGAAKVVQKWGTQPLDQSDMAEIWAKFSQKKRGLTAYKIQSLASLVPIVNEDKSRGKCIVFTNGCFDLLHEGHLSYLEEAKALGDKLIVGVNSDASIRLLKGESRPILPLETRMRLLAGLSCVDWVVSFEDLTPHTLIDQISPDILVKGADYTDEQVVGWEIVKGRGGRVARIDVVEGVSTSRIISHIRKIKDKE